MLLRPMEGEERKRLIEELHYLDDPAFLGLLEPRALKCMFLGYPQGVNGYKLWCMEKGHPRVLISRDVVFKESKMYHLKEDSSKGKVVWT